MTKGEMSLPIVSALWSFIQSITNRFIEIEETKRKLLARY